MGPDDELLLLGRLVPAGSDVNTTFARTLRPGEKDSGEAEQVHIARSARHCVVPELEQGRPLEDELVAMGRLRQAEQQALVRVAGQQIVEVLAALASAIEKTLADRGSKVPRSLRTHARASM